MTTWSSKAELTRRKFINLQVANCTQSQTGNVAGLWNTEGLIPSSTSVCTDGTHPYRSGQEQKSHQKIGQQTCLILCWLDLKNGAQLLVLCKMDGHQVGETPQHLPTGLRTTRCRTTGWFLRLCPVVLCCLVESFSAGTLSIWKYCFLRQEVRYLSLETALTQRLIELRPSGTEEQWWDPYFNYLPHSPKTMAESSWPLSGIREHG